MTASFVIAPPPQAAIAVQGDDKKFPVRRVWCVGRNYLEHIRELGNDERNPPFFFAKHADMIVPEGSVIAYPQQTQDFQHEVELIVALQSGGFNISAETALDHVWGYGVSIDLTRRDLQMKSRKKEQPWEIGKSFDDSAPCGALAPASNIGHPTSGKIWLSVNGTERQKGDLSEMIWNVAEIIAKLSLQVELGAGDVILTGTPAGVAALAPGDKIECGIDGIGTLKCSIGEKVK
ncbi:MAG: fumarylacetoacetate hydrolase family protein [Tardiphaga sp.]|nr:fumarylacetoacetate hydrolase family protein [Tardiphaga sp.]